MDTEVLKFAKEATSFGLIAMFILWLFIKAEPNLRKTIESMAAAHAESAKNMAESHDKAIKQVCETFERVITKRDEVCREERKEDKMLMQKEAELNRESRHEFANKLQEAIAELHEANREVMDRLQQQNNRPR